MFMINGTDYTLYIIAFLSVTFLFFLQLYLCRKTKSSKIRKLPLLFVAFLLVLALITYITPDTSGFIDLSGLVASILFFYAVICSAAIGLAWAVYKVKY